MRINLVSSLGIPRSLKNGDKIFATAAEMPLASKSSVSTKIVTRYGKMPTASGTADFAPSVKASYGLTFLKAEYTKIAINSTGIRYLDIYRPFFTKILTSRTPIIVDKSVARIVGIIISAGDFAPIDVLSARTDDGIS